MKYSLLFLGLTTFVQMSVYAQQQSAKIVRPSNLHEQPKSTSPVKYSLPAQANVNIQKRHRAWYHIKLDSPADGWVKMLNVRFVDGIKREGQIGVEGVFENMVTRQLLPTASTGVRGFDEAALKKAKANKEQLKKLHEFTVDKEKASAFASTATLQMNPNIKMIKPKQ